MIYKYIFLWPDGEIQLYIAHTIFEVVNDLESHGYNTQHAKVIKRPLKRQDLKEVNTTIVESVIKEMRFAL